jgi:hypothetical protein
MGTFTLVEQLERKWQPVMEHDSLSPIKDNYRRAVTAILLENQEQALREAVTNNAGADTNLSSGTSTAGLYGYDPILISLVRRAMPNLMAYDVASVQPMTAPVGLIFAMKSTYNGRPIGVNKPEALFNEAFTNFSGSSGNAAFNGTTAESTFVGDPLYGIIAVDSTGVGGISGWTPSGGMSRDTGEQLGEGGAQGDFNTMAFTIDRASVTAKTRALKAEYTIELAQDLKAIHGLDAETELSNILSTEILAEINREVVRSIYTTAKLGAQHSDLFYRSGNTYNFMTGAQTSSAAAGGILNSGGVYDLIKDSDGRWSAEKFRGLMFQIEREANTIAKDTRRGKGNFIICSADVASALAMGGFLNISPALNVNLDVDDTGNTFVGVLNGKIKVYVDPYSGVGTNTSARDFVCVGYKGTSPYDAGLFYCPYIPLQMVRAINDATFQPKIGFKTRYGMAVNPFVNTTNVAVASNYRANQYYRVFRVDNLHGVNAVTGA